MPTRDKFFTGSSVSRYLSPNERAWESVVYQSGKPPLDSEFNLEPDIVEEFRAVFSNATTPSGWVRGPLEQGSDTLAGVTSALGYAFPPSGNANFLANSFLMQRGVALVAGLPIVVEYANFDTPEWNRIQLDAAPVFGGAPPDVKRTDFVFLEVWRALVEGSPHATGTITVTVNPTLAGDNFNIAGNPLTGVLGAPGANQYQVGGSPSLTAAAIAAAINNSPPNAFTNVTATAVGAVITIRAEVAGVAGNALAISQTGVGGGGTFTFSGATLAGGADTANKPTQDTLYRHGNVDSSTAVDLPDDIEDPIVATETSKRVQIQYRIRVTGAAEAVNYKTQQDGFSNTNILAQGAEAAPVATYPFVPADNSTSTGNSDATAYGVVDPGLWVAGDGTSVAAAALGTVDGYVYALPICFVFRRNNAGGAGAGWSPLDNTNGALSESHAGFANPIVGAIPAGDSDRPDGKFHDEITGTDILDLRRHVVPTGMDWSTELMRQIQFLMDGQLRTWAIDTADKQDLGAGAGDVSFLYLVCDEIGRDSGEGGNPPASGDTTRGVTIANFDHVRRRFADQPVVERVLFALFPTDTVVAEPGKFVTQDDITYNGWAEDDEINIDLGALNATGIGDFSDASSTFTGGSGGSVSGFWPTGTTITNILNVTHDDGHFTTAVSQNVQMKLVSGMGTDHLKIILDRNDDVVNGGDSGNADYRMVGDSGTDDGSPRRIFVEVEITYPLGAGTSNTVDFEVVPAAAVYPRGPVLENDITQRPADWERLQPVRYRVGRREVHLEYVANDGSGPTTPITDTFVSTNRSNIRLARRMFGSGPTTPVVTDISTVGAGAPHTVDNSTTEYGSSSRRLILDISTPAPAIPLSGLGQTLVEVDYYAQDAIPNYGSAGGGYQVATYYRSVAPQTAGIKSGGLSLPATLPVRVLTVGTSLWTGAVGPGSVDDAFPYTVPMDQIPVNGDVNIGDFPGEWCFAATGQISVDAFSADTGLLNLHTLVPVDGTGTFTFSSPDSDAEFRAAYKVSDTSAYRPAIFAQPLSSVMCHKVWAPMLAVATVDDEMWRKGEVLLLVVTRFAVLDDENTIRFTDSGNTTCVGVYRTRGMFLVAGT